ncbi:MAG TPA: dihydroorotate dehydrogenase [Armatimonadetes bacterium]|jgi:dihydroorotate dehydrogenase (NAD+) catalytic subunit|nr:dihydroorotate dehydrogenase [Armatimonadota bacterium]
MRKPAKPTPPPTTPAVDLSVEIGSLRLRNPVTSASGTFGYGREMADLVDLSRLGALTVKTLQLQPRPGNPTPRICETPAGMINSIGLPGSGIEHFLKEDLPFLRGCGTPVILSVAGSRVEEYVALVERVRGEEGIAAIELNISCPNVKQGGLAFSVDPHATAQVVSACRAATTRPLIAKLTPNVTHIATIARAAADAGADAVAAINTIQAMAIDPRTRRPRIATNVGGLSGPAIRPIAVRMVWEIAQAVSIPIIGMGGITSAADALEFILAGATAVAVGTATFRNPGAVIEVIDGLGPLLTELGVARIRDLVGAVQPWE